MKLTPSDYEILIKAEASALSPFTKGTSFTFQYMRERCNRLIEISSEYEAIYPNEAKKIYNNG